MARKTTDDMKQNKAKAGRTVKKQWIALFLCVLLSGFAGDVFAVTKNQIDSVQDDLDTLQEKQKETKQKVNEIESQTNKYGQQIETYNKKIEELGNSLDAVQGEINEAEQNLGQVQAELKQLKAGLEETKEEIRTLDRLMRERICFIYEKGQDNWVGVLLGAENFADFINRLHYIERLTEYDKNQMAILKKAKEDLAAAKQEQTAKEAQITTEMERLAALQADYDAQQTQMEKLIVETKDALNAAQQQLAQSEKESEQIDSQIKQMEAYQKQLEEQYAAEEAARMAEIKAQEEEMKQQQSPPVSASASDETLLATLIYCEARGESYDSKLAVASVVINRVHSGHFPNTISGVIYQSGQFSPVGSGIFAHYLANEKSGSYSDCVRAAQAVISGGAVNSFLYFRTNASAQAAGISGTVIGNMTFY